MLPHELEDEMQHALHQIESVTRAVERWQGLLNSTRSFRANEDASIYEQLHTAFSSLSSPTEFPTFHEASHLSSQCHSKTMDIGGSKLIVTVTHRAPDIESVHGVDVIFQIDNWKAIGFQHKKRSASGRFDFGEEEIRQRNKIQRLCGICPLTPRRRSRMETGFVTPHCAALYSIHDSDSDHNVLVSACKIESFRTAESYSKRTGRALIPPPLRQSAAEEMFLNCTLGRLLAIPEGDIDMDNMADALRARNDILFYAELKLNAKKYSLHT